MTISSYENGFPNGLLVKGIPLIDMQNSAGHVFWVDGNYYGSGDSNKGTFTKPLKTLKAALAKCRAYQGDKIFLAAGHVEELKGTNNININVNGVQIIGLGTGHNRPWFILDDPAALMEITADNVYIGNVRFRAAVAFSPTPLETILKIKAKHAYLENLLFEGTSANYGARRFVEVPPLDQPFISDGVVFSNCNFYSRDPGAVTPEMECGIYIGDGIFDLRLHCCNIIGKFEKGCVYGAYTPAVTESSENIIIDGYGLYQNQLYGGGFRSINFKTAINGYISSQIHNQTYDVDDLDLELGGRLGKGISGDLEYIIRDVPYSSLTTTPIDLTGAVQGSYFVHSITLETDNAIATTSNLIIQKNGAELKPRGAAVFFNCPTVATFLANTTIDMDHPSVTVAVHGTITTAAKLQIVAGVDIASSGNLRILIGLRKIVDGTYFISPDV